MLLGCIGDDFTGSSDLASTLAMGGMHTVQYSGVPAQPAAAAVEAAVIALKSRSIAAADAVRQALDALEWLRAQGCRQYFFKYCSTFDSTADGNIGPVTEALAERLAADRVIVCPAFPRTGRSLYQGHLFVGDRLLNESGMQHHPLTPMTDADIRRWLALQVESEVGHVAADTVFEGADAIRQALLRQRDEGRRLVVVDAVRDDDLLAIGAAADDLHLVTGGSGVAMGLPDNFRRQGLIDGKPTRWRGEQGPCVALCGSCSQVTRRQVDVHRHAHPALAIDPAEIADGKTSAAAVAAWALEQPGIPLLYSSADPAAVASVQQQLGRDAAAALLESFFADTARCLVAGGLRRLLVAGGETSGAVVEGLGLDTLEIGPQIDPGVPALRAGPDLVLALKSGNFGGDDYFARAADVLARGAG